MNQTYEAIQEINKNSNQVIFLFHGTGADATDLLPLARQLDSDASVISVNGNVFSSGMRRYFDRNQQGIDLLDLENRSSLLADYLRELITKHDLADKKKIAIGYSNGANIIIGMMQVKPKIFNKVAILHGQPYLDKELKDVEGLDAFVSIGENDQLIDPNETMKLVHEMNEKSAFVTIYSHQSGHSLTAEEIQALFLWYQDQ